MLSVIPIPRNGKTRCEKQEEEEEACNQGNPIVGDPHHTNITFKNVIAKLCERERENVVGSFRTAF